MLFWAANDFFFSVPFFSNCLLALGCRIEFFRKKKNQKPCSILEGSPQRSSPSVSPYPLPPLLLHDRSPCFSSCLPAPSTQHPLSNFSCISAQHTSRSLPWNAATSVVTVLLTPPYNGMQSRRRANTYHLYRNYKVDFVCGRSGGCSLWCDWAETQTLKHHSQWEWCFKNPLSCFIVYYVFLCLNYCIRRNSDSGLVF